MYQQFSIPASSIDDIGTAVKPFGIDYKPERKDYVWKIEDTNPNTRDAKAAGWLGMYISRELSIYVFIVDTISFLFGDKRGGSRGTSLTLGPKNRFYDEHAEQLLILVCGRSASNCNRSHPFPLSRVATSGDGRTNRKGAAVGAA